ncbi:T-cell surface glycoprotein CD1a [Vulpes lagopus]
MLFLQLVGLAVLLPGGDSEDAFQGPVSFQVILTSSLYNRSSTRNQGSAWLNELQTHGWDSKTGAFIFLWTWSTGNLSNEELIIAERSFYSNTIQLPLCFHNYSSDWQLEYPFQVQVTLGCELHFGEPSVGFMRLTYQGEDLISFQNKSWWPSPKGGSRAQQVCRQVNELDHDDNELTHELITGYCPHFVLSLLDAGKADLQRQVRPEAWLSTGPSPRSGRLRLACHISGFYPKPVWVTWMRGVLGCESQGGGRPVLPGETQQSRRPGHGPPLGAAPLHGLGLPGGDRAPGAPGRLGVVALEALKAHWRPQCTDFPSEQDSSSPSPRSDLNPAQC